MKARLFLLVWFIPFICQAQGPIMEYYGHIDGNMATFDGNSHRSYMVVTAPSVPDQSASGANAVWSFTDLSYSAPAEYINNIPTTQESATYPGSTITTIYAVGGTDPNVSHAYFNTGSTTAFTGIDSNGINLNFINNATIGAFPLSYGYTNADPTSGTYTYLTYSGTFTGTIVSTVDSYGTLSLNMADMGYDNMAVTRLKTVQTINLSYIVPNVGTVVITNYHYYRAGDFFPIFTVSETSLNVPPLSISETNTTMEVASLALLGAPGFSANSVSISPNPVRDVLSVSSDGQVSIRQITVTDSSGRTVGSFSNAAMADISRLKQGVYFVRIDSDQGTTVKKIIKD